MKTLLYALLVVTFALPARADEISLLYLQTASSGTLKPLPGRTNAFQLVLNEIAPNVVYFSDRPNRLVGVVPMAEFLKTIGFGGELNPNAVISIEKGSKDSDLIVVTLAKPVYDKSRRTLTYESVILESAEGDLAIFSERMDKRLPAAFGPVVLFIDDNQCAGNGEYCGPIRCCPTFECRDQNSRSGAPLQVCVSQLY